MSADDVVVVAETRYHSLLRDETGYTIWDLRGDAESPVDEFPLTDDGMDDAFDRLSELERLHRRDRLLPLAAWLVVVVGAVWVLLVAFMAAIWLWTVVWASPGDPPPEILTRTSSLVYVTPALPTSFLIAIGIYVILWTQSRSRRDRD